MLKHAIAVVLLVTGIAGCLETSDDGPHEDQFFVSIVNPDQEEHVFDLVITRNGTPVLDEQFAIEPIGQELAGWLPYGNYTFRAECCGMTATKTMDVGWDKYVEIEYRPDKGLLVTLRDDEAGL